jgi:two-component system sensor histidine kinase QseC
MKLLNQSLTYLSISILIVIGLWSAVFYFNMFREITESVDEGLENYKRQVVYKAQSDTNLLTKSNFEEGIFAITEIGKEEALAAKDRYVDTLLYMQDADDEAPELEPVRMLETAFESKSRFFRLRIINSMVEEDDLIKELLWEALWLYLVLVAIIILINNVVLQRLWKPFYNLLTQLKSYRLGSSSQLPNIATKTKEFTDLQNAVNTLLQHSLETFDQQKAFIENASHELQTPLAIATNKLELLMERGNLDDTQAESIADVMQVIERLIRLNKSLLLLTKIENRQFLDNQPVSLTAVVREVMDELSELADYKNIIVTLTESSDLFMKMDRSLATSLVSNLLRNAIFHNVPDGKVLIDISEKGIEFRNTGGDIPLESEKIFSRFYKSESKQSGTGLGLAIVKAICGLYGLSISYHFEEGMHCFRLNTNSV